MAGNSNRILLFAILQHNPTLEIMIQDILPHQFDNRYVVVSEIEKSDYIFHFKGNELLLKQIGEQYELPQACDWIGWAPTGQYLFSFDGKNCFLVNDCPSPHGEGFVFHEVKSSNTIGQLELDWVTVVALQLKNWYAQHRFCGKCGTPTVHKTDERALECPKCQSLKYPVISPAIIVAIVSDDKILLARNVNFRPDFYSLVAGYVDVGESVEAALVREVREEVGMEIRNIRYYKSQPWPYSGSMMLAFVAEADERQPIKIDPHEIADANWYTRFNLPGHPTNRSIAGEMIEKFLDGEL